MNYFKSFLLKGKKNAPLFWLRKQVGDTLWPGASPRFLERFDYFGKMEKRVNQGYLEKGMLLMASRLVYKFQYTRICLAF